MKLSEALKLVQAMQRREGNSLRGFLVAGINPLHLKTFVTAELSLLFPDRRIEIASGIFGDLLGNLKRFSDSDREFGVALVEWSDLDPRLGFRSSARWSNSELVDILSTVSSRAMQLQDAIEEAGRRVTLVVSLPMLPLPPFYTAPRWQASGFELDLRRVIQSLSASICRFAGIRVLSQQSLDMRSPLAERLDVESDVLTGFPYRLVHASVVAASLAQLIRRPAPKKGLITDLDDTLWRGILGEDGIEGISWDLEHGSQMHAFYQRFLGGLASEGVLIGVASKNNPLLVEEALRRADLAISPNVIFPVEAHWNPKSQSVARILEMWNIGADAVVFVDDSPHELDEVRAACPEVEGVRFPTRDNAAIYSLTCQLRDVFGKSLVLEEDLFRLESIRRSHAESSLLSVEPSTEIRENLEARVTFSSRKIPMDPRALELVNKTNQFNLNGKRYTEASWHKFLLDPASFLLVASYRDKFGPLGKIAVLGGFLDGNKLIIHTWVMSCRAFSRRIEHKCLAELVTLFDPCGIEFEYSRTERNGPLCDFLTEVLGSVPSADCAVSREMLEAGFAQGRELEEVIDG